MRQIHRTVLALGTVLAAILIAVAVVGATQWPGSTFPGFLVLENGVVASAGLSEWPAVRNGKIFQTRITAYDGIPFQTSAALSAYLESKPAGTPVLYAFTTDDTVTTQSIESRRFSASDTLLLFGVMLFSALALISVALAIVYMAPTDPAAAGCSLALAITGTYALTAIDLYGPYRLFRLHALAECLLGAGGIHMALMFPHRRGLATAHAWIIPVGYALSLTIAAFNQYLLFDPSGYTRTHLAAMTWAGFAFLMLVMSQLVAFVRPRSHLSRQRVSILALGTLASILPAVIVAGSSSITGGAATENTISWTGAFFPLAVGYAVLQSDLLEIDSVVRRTVNYVFLSAIVGVAYALVIVATEKIFSDSNENHRLLTTVSFSLFLAFAMLPIRDRLQVWVDRVFFRSSYDFQKTVESTSNSLARMIELEPIRNRVLSTIRDTLNPESIELIVHQHADTEIQGSAMNRNSSATDADKGSAYVLEIDFQTRDRVVAHLRMGRKLSGRSYSSLDRALLKVISNQGAIAIENALTLERVQDLNRSLERRVAERTAELKTALDDLTATQAQLVQAERLAAVGELAAGIAHEVNNPLNFARNSLRTLRSLVEELVSCSPQSPPTSSTIAGANICDTGRRAVNGGPDDFLSLSDDIKQLVDILGSGLDRTARLVQDLREFANPQRGRRAAFRVSTAVTEALSLASATIQQHRIQISHSPISDEPPIEGDQNALTQVVLNVLKNSIDALEHSGTAVIEVDYTLAPNHDEIVLTISDNGEGIAPENISRLFEPFFTTKQAGKGTGLGLALCRRIVQDHRGTIDIQSPETKGTSVSITLPTTTS